MKIAVDVQQRSALNHEMPRYPTTSPRSRRGAPALPSEWGRQDGGSTITFLPISNPRASLSVEISADMVRQPF